MEDLIESNAARARQQETVAGLGQRALTGERLEGLLEAAVERIAQTLDVELSHIFRLEPGGEELRLVAETAEEAVAPRRLDANGPDQVAFTLRESAPVRVDDLEGETRFGPVPWLTEAGARSGMSVIVRAGSGPWGVLCAHARSVRSFSEDDVHFLQSTANVLGSAVAHGTARRELRRSERSFRDLVEHLPDAVAIFRGEHFAYVNRRLVEALGYDSARQIQGAHLSRVVHRDSLQAVAERQRQILETGEISPPTAHDVIRRNGDIIPAEVSAIPVEFDGEPAILAVARDLTERYELTTRMMQVDRMLAVATLAAGVGHEINNPLAYVAANLDLAVEGFPAARSALRSLSGVVRRELGEERLRAILREVGDEELERTLQETQSALEEARDGARRIRDVVRDLKSFSDSDDAFAPLDLRQVLRSSLDLTASDLRQRARLVEDLADTAVVWGSRGRLGQVFLNLLLNAHQALPAGAPDRQVVRVSLRRDGTWAVVEVADSGPGVPPEQRTRIFDPFFTTKPVGEGTGLGLAMGRRIVEQHDGLLDVDDAGLGGALFRVRLPIAPEDRTA